MKKFLNFLTVLGLLLFIAGFVVRQYEASQNGKYELVTGTITEVWMTSFNGSSEFYYFCPKLEFMTSYEQEIAYYPPCTTETSNYKKGEQLKIRYNPMYPGDAHLNGAEVEREWFEPKYSTFLMGLGLFVMLAGVVQTWWPKRKE
jgi:hypothetical protein